MSYKKSIVVVLFSSLMISGFSLASDYKTIGFGKGAQYNGLGFSYGLKEENSRKYISIGCLSIAVYKGPTGYIEDGQLKSKDRGTELNCGLGLGLIKTNLINKDGKKHGLGLHMGVTYNEYFGLNKIETFVAPQYIYYLKGIDKNGLNLGIALFAGERDGKSDITTGFNIGYYF